MWRGLFLVLSLPISYVTGQQPCTSSGVAFVWWQEVGMWYVRYDESPCTGPDMSRYFCEESGWGDKEATVVCREQGFMYGIGRYIHVYPYTGGYRHIECQGSETTLAECDIGLISHLQQCDYVAVVRQCSNAPQAYINNILHSATFPHYLVADEDRQSIRFCISVVGALTSRLFVDVNTHATSGSTYPPAIANYDYYPMGQTIIFEATDMMRSEQCLQVELTNDFLAEPWEIFTLLLSTNNSAVHLIDQQLDIYIRPNDNMCTEGSVTVVSDVNNSSLQLVEMCSSEGVWSPVCDYDWTLQDATVICRQLGYQGGTEPPMYATLESSEEQVQSGGVAYECQGNESRLGECMTKTLASPCYYVLVQCNSTTEQRDSGIHLHPPSSSTTVQRTNDLSMTESSIKPSINANTFPTQDSTGNSLLYEIAGTIVAVAVLAVTLLVVVALLIVWMKRKGRSVHGNGNPSQIPLENEQQVDQKLTSLENPTYQLTPAQPECTHMTETPEHQFTNPLYGAAMSGRPSRDEHLNTDYNYIDCEFNGDSS